MTTSAELDLLFETLFPDGVGDYLQTFEHAKYLIANCPTFQQQILDVATAAEALEKIHFQETLGERSEELAAEYEGTRPPEIEARPFCVIVDSSRTRTKIGVDYYAGEGDLIAAFEVPIPDALKVDYQTDDEGVRKQQFEFRKRWRMSLAGRLENEILERSGKHDVNDNSFLNVIATDLIIPPGDAGFDETEDFIGFAIALTWK